MHHVTWTHELAAEIDGDQAKRMRRVETPQALPVAVHEIARVAAGRCQ